MSTRRQFLIRGMTTLAAASLTACSSASDSASRPSAPTGPGNVADRLEPWGVPTGAPPSQGTPSSAATAPVTTSKASGELLVGVDLELSGAASVWAQSQLQAITLLADTLNAAGGVNGVSIRLIPYDNESNETKSLVVARRLIEEDRVTAIIGGGTTPTTMPVVPVANESQTPLVAVGSANAIVEPVEERRWIFKTPPMSRDVATKVVAYLANAGLMRIGFLSVNNAYGDAGRSDMEQAVATAGITVTTWEKFGATDSDMKPQLTRIRATGPDAIVAWAIPPAASIVDKNYQELGLTIPIVHDHGATSHAYQELAGDASEGSTIVTYKSMVPAQIADDDPVKAVATQYADAYQARFGTKAGGVDAAAHDALLVIARAAERSGLDRARLRDALEGLQGVVGTTGVFNLSARDHNGLTANDLVVAQLRGGQWTLIQGGAAA
jgi:branched-chain amino acid transport system substrate-binding protein